MTMIFRCATCLMMAVLVSGSKSSEVAQSRELIFDTKSQCVLLKWTSIVAKVTDAFCNGDIAGIVDTFLELGGQPTTTAIISTACSNAAVELKVSSGILATELCEAQVNNIQYELVLDFSMDCKDLAANGVAELQARFEENCIFAAEVVMEQLQTKVDSLVNNAELRLKKKYPKTTTKALGMAQAICLAAPIVGGLADTIYKERCIDVKTDLFIACSNMANYKWFNDVPIYPGWNYGYDADFGLISGDMSSWAHTWITELIEKSKWRVNNDEDVKAQIANAIAEAKILTPRYYYPNLTDEEYDEAMKDSAYAVAVAAGSLDQFDSKTKELSIEEVLNNDSEKTKLIQAKLWTKGANPNFCKYTTTYSFDAELAVAQIVDKVSATTKLNKIFTKDLSPEEFYKFFDVTEDACTTNGVKDSQSWFQLSDSFENNVAGELHMCISYVVTVESAATSYSLVAVSVLVVTVQLLLTYA